MLLKNEKRKFYVFIDPANNNVYVKFKNDWLECILDGGKLTYISQKPAVSAYIDSVIFPVLDSGMNVKYKLDGERESTYMNFVILPVLDRKKPDDFDKLSKDEVIKGYKEKGLTDLCSLNLSKKRGEYRKEVLIYFIMESVGDGMDLSQYLEEEKNLDSAVNIRKELSKLSKTDICNIITNMSEDTPPGVFFHKIKEKIEDIKTLKKVMIQGLIRYVQWKEKFGNPAMKKSEISYLLDAWMEHDNEEYFDYLVDEDDYDDFSGKVLQKVSKKVKFAEDEDDE